MIEQRLGNGFVLHHYQTVDSTNNVAAQLCRQGWQDQIAVLAEAQTAGRGRQGRVWQAPTGNLNLSIIWADQPAIGSLWSLVTGLAVAEAIEQCLPTIKITLKWPNDIMLADAKVGGVLIERPSIASPLIIGIGINVMTAPQNIADRAVIALSSHDFRHSATELAPLILDHLLAWRHKLARHPALARPMVVEQWQARAWGLGQRAEWAAGPQRVDGIARGLDHDGAFVIEDDKGQKIRVLAGEVGFDAVNN